MYQRYFIVMRRTHPTLSLSFANNFLSRHSESKRTFHRIKVTTGRQLVEFYFVPVLLCAAKNQNESKMDAMACSDRLKSRKVYESNRGTLCFITKQYTHTHEFPSEASVRSEFFGILKHSGSCGIISIVTFRIHWKQSVEVEKKKWM